jgi:adenylate cyclase
MAGIIEERDIGTLVPAMAAALEPAAMRHSMTSLLEVYLGNGPANRVAGGAFPRGAMTEIEAAVVITDLRGFTDLSERLAPDSLLQLLGGYFEVIVEAMRSEGGDVLKFMGDGVLSIFPAAGQGRREACVRAVRRVERAFAQAKSPDMRFVAAISCRSRRIRQYRQPRPAGFYGRRSDGEFCQPSRNRCETAR